MHRKPVQTIIVMLLAAIFTTPAWGQSLCTPIVVADNTSIYTPTQIFNGSFDEEPWMVFTYNNVTYNTCPNNPNFDSGGNKYATNVVFHGVDEGWNTTELSWWRGTLFEYTDGSSTHNCQHNSTIPMSDKYVEMNCYHATMLYQDLTTCGNDVIRWTLKHGVTSGGNEVQPMYVEIGAPNRDGNGNIINASGWADNLNPQIDVNTAAFFRYNGVTDKDNNASTRGFASESDLQYLRLTKSANYNGWWTAQGVYTIPEGQTVTRFGFVSEAQTPNSGNLLDDITFSTLIGNLTANFASTTDNTVLVKGYWGETDPTKKIKIVIGETTHELDMSNVIGQNFIITIPSTCFDGTPTQVTVYHADYENAKRILNVNYPISASATNTSGTYDGTTAYGINVTVTEPDPNASTTSGLTIKYGTTYGGCNLESLTYTNAGNYTVFYQVSADHYSTFIGSATVSIAKAASLVVTSPTPGVDMEYLNSTISLLTDGGTATGGDMVYALGTDDITPPTSGYSTSIPTGKSWGNYYVWYKVQGDANHNDSDPGVVVASITEPPTHNVTVSVRETGLGTVGINNDFTVNSTSIHTNDIVTINATPASGLTFVRWTDGDGVLQSTYNNYVATITEAIDFVADFGYNVSVNKTGNGTVRMDYTDIDNVSQTTGEMTGSIQCFTSSGTEVTLTATPDAHYHFKYWTNNINDQKVTSNTLTFTPTATITYTAVFAVDTHNVSIALNDPTKGNIFVKRVSLTEDFESGSMPNGWTSTGRPWTVVSGANNQTGSYCIKSGNAGNANSTSTITFNINLAHNGSISFRSRISSENNWDWGRFYIDGTEKFSRSGNGGWTTDSYELSAGAHTFSWSYTKDGSVNGNDDAFYVDDIIIKESVPASCRYTYGQACEINTVSEIYCYFKNWTDENNNVVGTATSKSFVVTGDTTITANFEISQYTVTLKEGTEDADNWSFSPSTARAGETVTVTYSGTKPIRSLQCPTTYEINSSSDVTTAVNNFNSHPGSRLLFNTDITANLTFTASEGEIDFNNHTLTGYVYAQNNVLGKSITFKDGTVTGGYDGAGGWNNWYYGTVMMENINVSTNQAVWTDGHAYIFCSGNYGPIQNLTRNGADVPGTAVIYNDVTYTSLNTGNNSNWHAGQTSFLNHNATPLVDYDLMEVMPDQQCQQCRQWTFTMPGYNVEATVDYFAVLTLAADGNGTVVLDGINGNQLDIPSSWENDYNTPLTAADLPGFAPVTAEQAQAWDNVPSNGNVNLIYGFDAQGKALFAIFADGNIEPNFPLVSYSFTYGDIFDDAQNAQFYYTTLPDGMIAGTIDNNYLVLPGTTVTVKATPTATSYVQKWDNDADINSNSAVSKVYTITKDTTAKAWFIDKPILTLTSNDDNMGTVVLDGLHNRSFSNSTPPAMGTYIQDGDTLNFNEIRFRANNWYSNDSWMQEAGSINGPVTIGANGAISTNNIKPAEFDIFQGDSPANAWMVYASNDNSITLEGVLIDDPSPVIIYPDGVTAATTTTKTLIFSNTSSINSGGAQYPVVNDTYPYQIDANTVLADIYSGVTVEEYYQIESYGSHLSYDAITKKITVSAEFTGEEHIKFTKPTGGASPSVTLYVRMNTTSNVIANTYVVDYGTDITINATPAEHHYMQKWNDEAAMNSNVAVSTTFTVTKDTALTAQFVHKPTLTLTSNPSTRGTVELEGAPNQLPNGVVQGNNANEYIVDYDTTVKVIATPIDHYHLASWNNIGGNNLTQYVTMTQDKLITGVFAIDTFTLTLKTNDQTMGTLAVVNTGNDAIVSHGTDATGTSTYKVNYGAEVIFKATANTGYHVGSWSNGATVTDLAESTQTITVTSDSTITANFAASQFTISFNSNGGTNVAPITQDYGTTILAPANPTRENLVFDGWIPAIPSTMPAENLELTAQWNFQGSGTETDPYIIPSTDVWNLLAQKVNAGNTYENKVFLQTADISDVTNMVGSPSTMFSGTYDGGGHTITLNLPTATADDAGPFRSINGATIKNLHTAGTVDGGVYGYAGGIAGRAIGNCNLINCRSSVTITASKDGDGSHGGLVGNSTGTTIEGCIFDGRLITTNNTYNCGGLVGWSQSGTIVHNCLFAPTEFTPAMAANWSSTIGRDGGNNGANYTIINTYYTQEFGWHHQGKQVRSITGGEGVTVANAGTDTVYNVSGITTYGTGIKYNNVLYGGNGDVISLNLSHENQAGHTFNQYTVAGGGTLANSTTNNPTLTMTDANQVINVEWKADLVWQLGGQPVPTEGVSGYVGFENHVTFPTLSNPHNLTVTYSSTNTDVATINATGDIAFVAAGETTIKATFTGNSDYASDEVTYTLTVKNPDTLTLASNNPQWGSVTLDNASSSNTYPTSTENIYCVLPGTDVTINAAAIQLYHVASWSDEGQHDLSANASYDEYFVTNPDRFPAKSSITITMTGDTTMIATFDINIYNINAAVANGQSELGTVQVAYTDANNQAQTITTTTTMTEVQATALKGSTTTLTAIPEAGFHFVNWTNGNVVLGTAPTLTTTEALTATANFDTTHAELAWSSDDFTGYTYIDFNNYKPTLGNPHNVNVRYGLVENVTSVKVNPETGYITNDYNVPRLITQGTYHIYAVHETDQTYYYDSVVYTLNVNWGAVVSILKNIEEGGTTAFQNAENDLTHAYSSNNAMMAYLAPGASFTVSADANEGYHFSKWQTGDNVAGYTDFATTSEATYTAPAQITSMFSIGLKAIFDTNTYALNVLSDNAEMGTVSGSNPAAKHFLDYEISATPTLGYFFNQWNDGNTVNPRTVSLTSDSTFTAYFAPDTFTITYMDGDVRLKVDTFLYRQPITEYSTSKEKWRFDGWDPEVPELMPAENLTVFAIWYRLCEPLEDVDHNTYQSVNIGNKCWMAENLRTLHYYDGREITNIYEYQSSLYPNAEENVTIFGRLYDWYDAADASRPTRSTRIQGICPEGWFLPNEEDFELLNNADLHTLRSTNYWLYNNGDNSTGFDWRPSGMYNMNTQRYENLLGNAYLWSSFSTSSTEAHCHMADCNCYLIYDMITQKENAYSVRCIQD